VRSCPGEDERDLFIKAPLDKVSLELVIIFEDKNFRGQSQKPMRINVNLPEAKIYAYDLDYCTICKFFMENLGEQAQTIVGPYNYDEKNENVCKISILSSGWSLTSKLEKPLENSLKAQEKMSKESFHTSPNPKYMMDTSFSSKMQRL